MPSSRSYWTDEWTAPKSTHPASKLFILLTLGTTSTTGKVLLIQTEATQIMCRDLLRLTRAPRGRQASPSSRFWDLSGCAEDWTGSNPAARINLCRCKTWTMLQRLRYTGPHVHESMSPCPRLLKESHLTHTARHTRTFRRALSHACSHDVHVHASDFTTITGWEGKLRCHLWDLFLGLEPETRSWMSLKHCK